MSYQIVENDVRLLRRILVALHLRDVKSARKIITYLRNKGLKFKLPGEQGESERVSYAARLPTNEQWLVEQYGCVLLPEYHDIIFLNSKWRNPYTLYVRLVEPVPELGEEGAKYWVPKELGLEEEFRAQAERDHKRYQARAPLPEKEPEPWYRRIFG
jgi:hypothetical protein